VKLYAYTSDEQGVRHALVDEAADVTVDVVTSLALYRRYAPVKMDRLFSPFCVFSSWQAEGAFGKRARNFSLYTKALAIHPQVSLLHSSKRLPWSFPVSWHDSSIQLLRPHQLPGALKASYDTGSALKGLGSGPEGATQKRLERHLCAPIFFTILQRATRNWRRLHCGAQSSLQARFISTARLKR
jgi:hypothetical protein